MLVRTHTHKTHVHIQKQSSVIKQTNAIFSSLPLMKTSWDEEPSSTENFQARNWTDRLCQMVLTGTNQLQTEPDWQNKSPGFETLFWRPGRHNPPCFPVMGEAHIWIKPVARQKADFRTKDSSSTDPETTFNTHFHHLHLHNNSAYLLTKRRFYRWRFTNIIIQLPMKECAGAWQGCFAVWA